MKDDMKREGTLARGQDLWTPPYGTRVKRVVRKTARARLKAWLHKLVGAEEESDADIKREVDSLYDECSDPDCRFCKPKGE